MHAECLKASLQRLRRRAILICMRRHLRNIACMRQHLRHNALLYMLDRPMRQIGMRQRLRNNALARPICLQALCGKAGVIPFAHRGIYAVTKAVKF